MGLTDALGAESTLTRRRFDRAAGVLLGGRCADCAATTWPSRAVCHECGSTRMEETAFGPGARLATWTTVWVDRPGLPAPYTVGQLWLDDGPRMFGHVRDLPEQVPPAPRMRIVFADDAAAVPPFWFEPDIDNEDSP